MFNTLKYAKILEEVGFSREQAETSIKILVDIMEDRLATKDDLQRFMTKEQFLVFKDEFLEFKIATKHEFQEVRQLITQVESKLTIRMGTMLAASIAVLTALQKLI
ncbi:MAG: hypothetical protein HYW49_07605 [Deltaproteobacteria bacterium]|nr:hypothetical protein [Deltaproteobacteria bacterium]